MTHSIFENRSIKTNTSIEDEATLYSLSCEYLEAARILIDTPPTKINFSLVIYMLLGHSAELVLKSYLSKNGVVIQDLKNTGHNLNHLIDLVRENEPSMQNLDAISALSSTYKAKELNYRKSKYVRFPDKDQLLMEVVSLQRFVFHHIISFEYN